MDWGLGRDVDPDPESDSRGIAVRRRGRELLLHPALTFDRRAVLGLSVLLLLAVGYAVQHFWLGRPEPVPIPVAVAATVPTAARDGTGAPGSPASETSTGQPVVVDVAGKVQHPGLRSLPSGSRIADALRAAGGPLPEVDTDGLNMARMLTDGEQILVGAQSPAEGGGGTRGPLSLNHATVEQLDALPGVGPTLAQRIVLFRQSHGGFRSLDQLRQITGIGQRKFVDLRPLLSL